MSEVCHKPVAVCSRTFSKHGELRKRLSEKFSNIRFNDDGLKLKQESLVNFLDGIEAAIVALEPVEREVLEKLPNLKAISKYGVGLDNIDQELLKEFNVKLGWSGGVNRRSVSELALGFILGLQRRIFQHNDMVKEPGWKNLHGHQISDLTIGIIGCGHIGKDLVSLLKPFGCKILINDIVEMGEFCNQNDIQQASFDEVIKNSDVISLHVPYTTGTHHLISKDQLKMMKKDAALVNTSRGNVVCEGSLFAALKSNEIASAALDVFSQEPPKNSPLLGLSNFFATPHNGGSSFEGVLNMGQSAIDHLYRMMMEK